jgi:uncharacterized membrane protein/uncharacterized membrane protein YeaQ/YmgE (transglycosylase-associated protein family)
MTQVLIWMGTGVFVGWIVRLAMRTRRDYGMIGDLLTGSLGAVVGGWLLESLGVTDPRGWIAHMAVALIGAMVLLGGLRVLRRAVAMAGRQGAGSLMPTVADLEARFGRLGEIERRVLSSVLRRGSAAGDPNRSFDAQLTVGQRLADHVANFGGSWTFIGLFLTMMVIWMAINRQNPHPFDPYPFILLNLMLSCLAALQAPVIMMSQNRQAAKDRSDAKLDYEVNVRAEVQITALHEKLDATIQQDLARIARALDEQREQLQALSAAIKGTGRLD